MRKFMTFVFCALFLSATAAPAFAEAKMAYLDLSRVFDEYTKTKEYDTVLEDKHKSFEDERNKKIEEIREKQGKLAVLKEEEKARLQEELDQLRAELLEFDRQQKADLTKQRDEKIREILLEIESTVSEYAEKEKIDVVLNDRVLVFGSDTMNITDAIVKILNEKFSKKK